MTDKTSAMTHPSEGDFGASGGIGRLRRVLRETFFPTSIRLTGRPLWIVSAVSALFVLACFPLLMWWRSFPTPQNLIWAEDGTHFLQDAMASSWWGVVLTPYNGYAHLIPRTIAALIVELPVERWALAIALASILVRALIAVFVWHATSGHVQGRLARAAVSVVVVTIPLGGQEVLNNLANLHWLFVFACVPALLWRPNTWFGMVLQCGVVVGAALSDPLALLWAPFVVLRILAVPRWRDHIVSAVYVVAVFVQLTVTLGTTADRPRGSGIGVRDLVKAFLARTVEPAFAGIGTADWAWQHARLAAYVVSFVVVSAILVGGMIPRGPHRGLILSCFAASVVLYSFTVEYALDADELIPGPAIDVTVHGRYGFVSGLLLLTAIIAAGWSILHFAVRGRLLLQVAAALLVALYIYGVVDGYGYRFESNTHVDWTTAVRTAGDECVATGEPGAVVSIDPGGWTLMVRCADVIAQMSG